MNIHQGIVAFLKAALECSVYICPLDPGLTYGELVQAAEDADFLEGEIKDGVRSSVTEYYGSNDKKINLGHHDAILLNTFFGEEEPDYRNKVAFHRVFEAMRYLVREKGIANAFIDRPMLVERCVANQVSVHDVQVAIAVLLLNKILCMDSKGISFAHGRESYGSPGDPGNLQRRSPHQPVVRRESRARAYPIVKQIIDARDNPAPVSKTAAAPHVESIKGIVSVANTAGRTKIFIGHGRSNVWKDLRDFLRDRLKLTVDEYNIVPTAGIATVERLQQMLEEAIFAFMVMTAEDEQPDGLIRARENVVHEVGLFQGALGFRKAIIMLENGCAEFSNVAGLGQIRFPSGHIQSGFEEVRGVLEREKIIKGL